MPRNAARLDPGIILPVTSGPDEAEYEIAGHRYLVRVWTHAEWGRTEESMRPPVARPLGRIGWIVIQPSAN
jgi:hypothetical protein